MLRYVARVNAYNKDEKTVTLATFDKLSQGMAFMADLAKTDPEGVKKGKYSLDWSKTKGGD